MATFEAYLRDPCGAAALAFWKENSVPVPVPATMRIVHERDFNEAYLAEFFDEPYFKLLHRLKRVDAPTLPRGFSLCEADMPGDAEALASLLTACYKGSAYAAEDVLGFTRSPAYAPELWLFIRNEAGALCGAGLADCDAGMREGILEWIQLLPAYRGKGLGRAVVNGLLRKLSERGAHFATVSGQINNATAPEALYRACGFTGDDVWHVLRKKEKR